MDETGRGLVTLTGALVDGLGLPAQWNLFASRCADLLEVQAMALLGLDVDGERVLEAASEETVELLTRFELAYDQGPGVDAFRTGESVECVDLSAATLRWPRYAPLALEAGVVAAFGLPCRLQNEVVGAMTLYTGNSGPLPEQKADFRRGLVDTITLGVAAHRGREMATRAAQLQSALDSRVVIEQAKGILAERMCGTVDEAFTVLRDFSRRTGTKMRHVAQDVVKGVLNLPTEG